MRNCYLIVILCLWTPFLQAQYKNVSFYVVAHQDDWQLFMGCKAYDEIENKDTKNVFIYTTAGNSKLIGNKGNGEGKGDCKTCTIPYFKSRELGAMSSIYLVNPESKVFGWCKDRFPYPEMTEIILTIDGKQWYIKKQNYCNTVSYFLRLMDGGLAKLNKGDTIKTAIENSNDHQNSYQNWSDLTAVLREIINQEKGTFDSFWLNTHEVDATLNPKDHQDHLYTGIACNEATKGMKVNFNYYLGYQSDKLPNNLSPEDAAKEAGLLAAYDKSKLDAGWWGDWEESKILCTRNYSRAVLYPEVVKPIEQIKIAPLEEVEEKISWGEELKKNGPLYFLLIPILFIWTRIFLSKN